jgi:hypothetical protein
MIPPPPCGRRFAISLKHLFAVAGTGIWLALDTASGLPLVSTVPLGTLFVLIHCELLVIEAILRSKPGW